MNKSKVKEMKIKSNRLMRLKMVRKMLRTLTVQPKKLKKSPKLMKQMMLTLLRTMTKKRKRRQKERLLPERKVPLMRTTRQSSLSLSKKKISILCPRTLM